MNKASLTPAFLGEFLGTALLVLLGDGVVASVVLLNKQADWIVITTGWGLAVTLGVYLSGRVSGGHINPAVTVALALRGEFPWPKVPAYVLAQLAGAFVGALLVYVDYAEGFTAFEQANGFQRGSMTNGMLTGPSAGGAGVFCTFPAFDVPWRNVFSEVLGTAVLLLGVRALTDRRNAGVPGFVQPLLIGALVFSIGLSLGGLTGYAINPARDLGPRLAAAATGWGSSVFLSHNGYFWIPLVGPLIGGPLGLVVYDLTIGRAIETKRGSNA